MKIWTEYMYLDLKDRCFSQIYFVGFVNLHLYNREIISGVEHE